MMLGVLALKIGVGELATNLQIKILLLFLVIRGRGGRRMIQKARTGAGVARMVDLVAKLVGVARVRTGVPPATRHRPAGAGAPKACSTSSSYNTS